MVVQIIFNGFKYSGKNICEKCFSRLLDKNKHKKAKELILESENINQSIPICHMCKNDIPIGFQNVAENGALRIIEVNPSIYDPDRKHIKRLIKELAKENNITVI